MDRLTPPALPRRLLAELLGTALLVAIVVGSGVAASRLSPNDIGIQLLENSFATALGLGALIVVLAPVSGAHFNPAVSLAAWYLESRTRAGLGTVGSYSLVQVVGGIGGAVLANVMFELPTAVSTKQRISVGTFTSEVVATACLVLLIFALVRAGRGPTVIGPAVGAYIGAAYWFTSSTSFANPAVTIGRVFSDSFAGIAPTSVLPFLAAQVIGTAVAVLLVRALFPTGRPG